MVWILPGLTINLAINLSFFVDKTRHVTKRLLKMDGNQLQFIFYKDPYTGEIF